MEPLIIGEYYTIIDKVLPYNNTRRWYMKVTGYSAVLGCFEIDSSLAGDSMYLSDGEHFRKSLIIKGLDFPFKTEIDFGLSTNQPDYFFITTDSEGLKSMLLKKCINLSSSLLTRIYIRSSLQSLCTVAPFKWLFFEWKMT